MNMEKDLVKIIEQIKYKLKQWTWSAENTIPNNSNHKIMLPNHILR